MSDPRIQALTMPKWGMAMDEGTVTAWHIAEGEPVNAGDEVLDVESTKIANAIEAKAPGLLRRQVAEIGQILPVGALLGIVAQADVSDAEVAAFIGSFKVVAPDGDEFDDGPKAQTIDVDGRPIRYVVQGEAGKPILMIHGFGGDLGAWMFNQPALAVQNRVFACDLPGHGGSDKYVGDGSVAHLARAMSGFADALKLDHFHLVGQSLGGGIALAVALESPHRIASLTLIAPVGLGPEINGDYIRGFVSATRARDMKEWAKLLFADGDLVTRKMVEDILRMKRIDGAEAALRKIADAEVDGNRQKTNFSGRVSGLGMPVQIVWGAKDRIIPVKHAYKVPTAKVTVLEGAGHMPMMEKVGEVNQLIAAFVD
jgi:pyruvate dehydrogenase E2 component (dihydrolipoamide acetyltransferase)